jgi:hypothetical protein
VLLEWVLSDFRSLHEFKADPSLFSFLFSGLPKVIQLEHRRFFLLRLCKTKEILRC